MRIVEWRELTVPLEGGVRNAAVSFADHTVSLVAAVSDQCRNGRPVVGFGFNSIGRYGQGGILRERLFPRLRAADPDAMLGEDGGFDPAAVAAIAMTNEKPGGHGDRAAAVAAVELAVWDLAAKLRDEPAYVTVARAAGRPVTGGPVPVYAAGGYYGDDTDTDGGAARLRAELDGYRVMGFDACKIKIGGAPLDADLARIEAALEVVGDGAHLAVDANGRFDLERAQAYGEAIAPYGLRWYEEPGDPLDYALHRALTDTYAGPLATGENLFSAIDAENLVRFGGLRPGTDVLQVDPGLSYGVTEYRRLLEWLEANGFDRTSCFPHGGHLINLHLVVGLGLGGCEAYPGVFQPFGGYAPTCEVGEGTVRPSEAAGFGLEEKPEVAPHLAALTGDLT